MLVDLTFQILGVTFMWTLGYFSGKWRAQTRASEERARLIESHIAYLKANP